MVGSGKGRASFEKKNDWFNSFVSESLPGSHAPETYTSHAALNGKSYV